MKTVNFFAAAAAVLMMCTNVFGAAHDPYVSVMWEEYNSSTGKDIYHISKEDGSANYIETSSVVLLYVNGDVIIDANPIIKNGTTLVPLKVISSKLGAEVNWDGAAKTVSIVYGSTTISATIGKSYLVINGENTDIPSPSEIINSTTYVPLRAIATAFGAEVGYDGTTFTVENFGAVKIVWVQNKSETSAMSKEEAEQAAEDFYFNYIKTDKSIREQIYGETNKKYTADDLTPENINDRLYNGYDAYACECCADLGEYYYIKLFNNGICGAFIDKYDGSFYPVGERNTLIFNVGEEGKFAYIGPIFA